jgi:PAS domain-containing protein
MRFGRGEHRAMNEIVQRAETFREGSPPILEQVVPLLRVMLGSDLAGAYRPSPDDSSGGWKLDFDFGMGVLRAPMRDYLASTSSHRPIYGYDALSPEPRQRNVVRRPTFDMRAREREYRSSPFFVHVFEPAGMAHHDQLRVLLCDGPVLMAWIGGVRTTPFTKRERSMLRAVVAPVGARLSLERRLLRADLLEKGLAAALDLTTEIALLCTRDGRVAYASPAGQARLDAEPGAYERVRAILEGKVPGVTPVPIQVPGLPLHLLVTLGARERLPGGSPRFDERLQAASREWKLTPRQTAVLERVVRGDSNKQIAERLR